LHPSAASWSRWIAVITSALRELGATFDVVAESHQPEVLREMVALGMGWTVLPIAQGRGLTPARGKPIAERRLVVARRIGAPPHPGADALVALLASSGGAERTRRRT
jgi:DNA-binding transcriptional LysR family regulator